jgi:hypothetical protein
MNPHLLLNAALFQMTWFSAVLFGVFAGLACVLLLAIHGARGGVKTQDLVLGSLAAAVGFGLDTLWIHTGILDFHGAVIAPPWIVVLWLATGLTLNHSLEPMARRPLAGAATAGLAAPVSYLSGEALGGVIIPRPELLLVVAVTWFVLFHFVFRTVAPFFNRQFINRQSVDRQPGESAR